MTFSDIKFCENLIEFVNISENTMAKYIAAVAYIGAVLADGGSHSAGASSYAAPAAQYASPSNDYAAPQAAYGAPAYEAPAAEYGAPTYEEPVGYQQEYAPTYEGALDTVDGFDLSKFTELIPLFIAVFAAIIIAQLVAPLFAVLFGAKVTLLTDILSPLRGAKLGLANAILAPFDLVLGSISAGNCVAATKRSFDSSSMDIMTMIDMARNVYDGKKII